MQNFTAHRLRFVAEAQSTIELNEHQGSAIRGALYHALRNRFCGNREARACDVCPVAATCPVATLVSTLNPQGERGRNVPRPYTIQPPLPGQGGHAVTGDDGRRVFLYRSGERLEFGLTLYAQALQLFPYVVLALQEFAHGGLGRRTQQVDGRWLRGRLRILEVWAENPLRGTRQAVLQGGGTMVQVPDVPITHQDVLRVPPPAGVVTLRFLTPVRLISGGRLVKPHQFRFQPFFQRLMERLESLSKVFSDTPLQFPDPQGLIAAAGQVWLTRNQLHWEELRSYSTRQRRSTPIGGLVGSVSLAAEDWSPFWPWLVWGQFVQVGKDAVKGNGLYLLDEASAR